MAVVKQVERALHSHVYQLLSWLKPDCIWFPVPNGVTDLGTKRGGMLKAQGKIKAGVADFCFMWGEGSGMIELKSPTGSLSTDQRIMQGDCGRKGVNYAVCRSLDAVVITLHSWGRITQDACENFIARRR